jgi:hypothetical protein
MYIFCFFERETIFHDTTITSIVSGGRRSLHFVKGGKNLAEADGADENVFVPQFFWRIFKKKSVNLSEDSDREFPTIFK